MSSRTWTAPTSGASGGSGSAISHDGGTMVLTLVDAPDGFGDCDLYIATMQKDGKWSKPKNMGPAVNTGSWESHPTISRDSRTVYFASDRPGGVGGIDIYMTTRLASGEWSDAKNVAGINTPGNDVTPYVSLDDSTMYFSSDGVVEGRTGFWHVRPWRQVELSDLMSLYDAQYASVTGSVVRSEEYWRWLIGRRYAHVIWVACQGEAVKLSREEWYTLFNAGRGGPLP